MDSRLAGELGAAERSSVSWEVTLEAVLRSCDRAQQVKIDSLPYWVQGQKPLPSAWSVCIYLHLSTAANAIMSVLSEGFKSSPKLDHPASLAVCSKAESSRKPQQSQLVH